MTTGNQLLPCPFCGGRSEFNEHDDECYFTSLAKAKASPKGDVSWAIDLIPAWNRRAALTHPAQPAEGGEAWAKTASELNRFAHTGKWPEDSPAPPASQEQLTNGLTEAETSATASVMGLTASQEQAQQQPSGGEVVAWRTFDGEGGYEYRDFEGNENYADGWAKRNPRHKGWVEALTIATPNPEPMTWQPIETAPKDGRTMFVVRAFDVIRRLGATPYTSDPWCVWQDKDGFSRWPHSFEPTHWMPLPPAPITKEQA